MEDTMVCRHTRRKMEHWTEHLWVRRLEGAVGIRGVGDLEGEVGRSGSNGGGGEGGSVD